MGTIVKIEDSPDDKKLLTYLKSLRFVKIVGDAGDFIDVKELKKKVSRAEKSASLTLDQAIRKSESWKYSKYNL